MGQTRRKATSKWIYLFLLSAVMILAMGMYSKLNEIKNENMRLKAEVQDLRAAVQDLGAAVQVLEEEKGELQTAREQLEEQIESRDRAYRMEILHGLADLKILDPSIIVDLKYATTDNFTKKQVYPDNSRALLRRETAVKLLRASEIFQQDGYRIKIFDAYRPLSAQKILWEHSPIPGFLANPDRGSKHNRGASVDMTLVDRDGNELEMPTGYDDFTERAARDYPNHSPEAKKNMDYMTEVMVRCGFKGIRTEWWHFDDVDAGNYPLLDIGLDAF